MSSKYKIGFYTTCSPFYGSRLAMWRHHDATWNILCRDHDVELHVILPVVGGAEFSKKLYGDGDTSVLYPTLRTQNIVFHEHPDTLPELDALYLDDIHTYSEDVGIHPDDQHKVLKDLIYKMSVRRAPIILSDTDGFTTEILENTEAAMMDLYNYTKSITDDYTVISPFINDKIPEKNRVLVPFEVDPSTLNNVITPLSKRPYLCRMIANFYYREHYIPILNSLSDAGTVQVNGSGWNPYKEKMPNVIFKKGISMSPNNVDSVYNMSAIGLVGRSGYNIEHNQVIYLYRWKEYLQAGIRIVPEDVKQYTDLLPEGSFTTADILNLSPLEIKERLLDISDEEYLKIIQDQRESALEFLSVHKWVPVFREILRL